MQLPTARTTEIIEQDLDNELLIYDLRIDKAYTLNETSTKVYLACDGRQTFEDLKRQHKYTDDLIHLALQELNANKLLENYAAANHFAGLSRREVIRKVGLATIISLPVIASITAPKAIHAASNQQANDFCEEVECPYAQDACHFDGVCDPNTGDCLSPNVPSGTVCDDNDVSTINDMCDGNGNCVGTCDSGLTDCNDVAPRCKNLQTDSNNCGACGNVCLTEQTCSNSICMSTTPINRQ